MVKVFKKKDVASQTVKKLREVAQPEGKAKKAKVPAITEKGDRVLRSELIDANHVGKGVKGPLGPVDLLPGEQWYISLGNPDPKAARKGCALFLAIPTKDGFRPTRGNNGEKVACLDVKVDANGIAKSTFSTGNPTPDGFKAYVAERREGGTQVMRLTDALTQGEARALKAKVNGVEAQLYVPKWFKPGTKLPMLLGMKCGAGRIETNIHKAKIPGTNRPRNADVFAKVEL